MYHTKKNCFALFCFVSSGAKGGYSRFAGRDISRALAKMSFSPEDLESSSVEKLHRKVIKAESETMPMFNAVTTNQSIKKKALKKGFAIKI